MQMLNRILYKYSNMDSSSQILIFLIILIFLMLISISIINIITKKKALKNDISNKYISKVSTTLNESENVINPNIKLETKVEDDIEVINDNDNDDVVEISVKKTSIDEISNMIQNTLEQKPIDLTKFEEDQEENAIISYDELVKKAGAKKIVYKIEENSKESKETNVENIESEKEKTKFRASKIISPVFGIQKELNKKDETFTKIEKTNEIEDIETLTDVEFLGSLKKFRNELDSQ